MGEYLVDKVDLSWLWKTIAAMAIVMSSSLWLAFCWYGFSVGGGDE